MCSSIWRLSSALLLSVNPLGPFVGVRVLRCALRRFRKLRIWHNKHYNNLRCSQNITTFYPKPKRLFFFLKNVLDSQLSAEWQQLCVVWDCICVVGNVVSLCDLSKLSEWAQLPVSPALPDISPPELRDTRTNSFNSLTVLYTRVWFERVCVCVTSWKYLHEMKLSLAKLSHGSLSSQTHLVT